MMTGKEEIAIWPQKPKKTRPQVIRRLRKLLKSRVEQAYLFGSFAQGDATNDSDIDLILICKTRLPWPERGKRFNDLHEQFGAVDLLVYSPAEWQDMCAESNGFIEMARRHWVRVV